MTANMFKQLVVKKRYQPYTRTASRRKPGGRPQPQLYPRLRFAAKNVYNQKLDEVLAWTSSPHESSDKSTSSKESLTSSIISEAISAAPTVIGTIAATAGATEIAKLASDWAGEKEAKKAKDAKDVKDAKDTKSANPDPTDSCPTRGSYSAYG
ncbi:hypothetical protein BGX21_006820, partial [Mortierella sp. AD011]